MIHIDDGKGAEAVRREGAGGAEVGESATGVGVEAIAGVSTFSDNEVRLPSACPLIGVYW